MAGTMTWMVVAMPAGALAAVTGVYFLIAAVPWIYSGGRRKSADALCHAAMSIAAGVDGAGEVIVPVRGRRRPWPRRLPRMPHRDAAGSARRTRPCTQGRRPNTWIPHPAGAHGRNGGPRHEAFPPAGRITLPVSPESMIPVAMVT
jgi:hypothetical protein